MSVHNHCQRFVKQLLTQPVTTDLQLTALEARLIGQLGLVFPYDFIEEQIKNACSILSKDISDAQKHFAVSLSNFSMFNNRLKTVLYSFSGIYNID